MMALRSQKDSHTEAVFMSLTLWEPASQELGTLCSHVGPGVNPAPLLFWLCDVGQLTFPL